MSSVFGYLMLEYVARWVVWLLLICLVYLLFGTTVWVVCDWCLLLLVNCLGAVVVCSDTLVVLVCLWLLVNFVAGSAGEVWFGC